MSTIKLEIVTAEKMTFSEDVTSVLVPGAEGQLGILPHHAPLMSILKPGEMVIKRGAEEMFVNITGGFLEVRPQQIIVLADAAELPEEIDIDRAREAKKRAEERMLSKSPEIDHARAEAALSRALIRLKVAERNLRSQKQPRL
jgi:F-type H+-transporting ATPase subunit epsilon